MGDVLVLQNPFPLGSPGREVAAPGDDRAIVEGFKGDTCAVVTFIRCPQLVKGPQEARIEWLVNGLFHLLINGVHWDYSPLTNL